MPCCNVAQHKRLQRFLYHPCSYTAHATKRRTGLCRRFSCCLPYFIPIIRRRILLCCAACAMLEGIQADAMPPARTRYHRHAGRRTSQHSRPIIIRYIRVHPYYESMPDSAAHRRPCKPGGGLDASHARRLAIWHRVSLRHHPPGGAVQQQGQGGRRGIIDGYRRISFRAFAR